MFTYFDNSVPNFSLTDCYPFSLPRHVTPGPANTLPNEILLLIFSERFFSQIEDHLWNPSLHINDAPWNLTRVCKQWRSVAIGFPMIWSSINLLYSEIDMVYRWKSFVHTLSLHVERSQQEGLAVAVYFQPLNLEENANPIKKDIFRHSIAAVLAPTSKRWVSLLLYDPCLEWECLHDGEYPRLEHLEIDTRPTYSQPITLFQKTPALTSLKIYGVHFTEFDISESWSRLKTLTFTAYQGPHSIEKFRFVEDLTIDNYGYYTPGLEVYEPVEFPFLTRLTSKMASSHMDHLMRIRAPQLRALHMLDLGEHTVRVLHHFPTITFLSLVGYLSGIPPDHDSDEDENNDEDKDDTRKWRAMRRIFREIPSTVETLEVKPNSAHSLWTYLNDLKVLPNLKKVVVDHHAMERGLVSAFLNMAETRELDVQIELKGRDSLVWMAECEEPVKERWARVAHRAIVTYSQY